MELTGSFIRIQDTLVSLECIFSVSFNKFFDHKNEEKINLHITYTNNSSIMVELSQESQISDIMTKLSEIFKVY